MTPIIASVYSEAVDRFADVVEVGFGESYAISVGSNDIPVFQDSSWGASRSVPSNRFYSKDYTLNPQPKTAQIVAKWFQLVGNNQDFGVFFANIVAGMYAKTMGMWNAALTAAASDTTLIPANLNFTFSNQNWLSAANKIAALNNTVTSNLFATGSAVALGKVLPTQATGSTNVNMDAALAMLLGERYNSTGMLGEFLGVRLMPLRDAVSPVNLNTAPTTILSANDIWMMAANSRKPMTIAYNSATPITSRLIPRGHLTSLWESILPSPSIRFPSSPTESPILQFEKMSGLASPAHSSIVPSPSITCATFPVSVCYNCNVGFISSNSSCSGSC